MDEIAASLRSRRYYSLDLWRGVACLMVIAHHASYYITENPAAVAHGIVARLFHLFHLMYAGVPIFFVISGYCIAAACDALRPKTGGVRKYFYRRVRRIYPPFWIVFGLFFIGAMALALAGHAGIYTDDIHPIPIPTSLSPGEWLGNLTLTEMWRFTLFHRTGSVWDGLFLAHSWTLCYEEQFYAVCGVALFLSRRWFFHTLGAITLVVIAITCVQLRHALPIDGFFFDGRWLTFATGVGVYYRIQYASPRGRVCFDTLLGAALIVLCIIARRHLDPIVGELIVALAFALLIVLLYRWDRQMNASTLLAPLTACGTMCYSLYLVHWPIVKVISHAIYVAGIRDPWPTLFVTMPVCFAASIGAGWVFFVLVERRFLNSPIRKMQRETSLSESLSPSLS